MTGELTKFVSNPSPFGRLQAAQWQDRAFLGDLQERSQGNGPRVLEEPRDRLTDILRGYVARSGLSLRWEDVARRLIKALGKEFEQDLRARFGDGVLQDDLTAVRAMAENATIGDAIEAVVGTALVAGFEAEPDTTTAWTREMPAEHFQDSDLFVMATGSRLKPVAAGGIAPKADYALAKTTYRVRRYATTLEIDERAMLDDKTLGVVLSLVFEMGAEARRVRPDLVYSLILRNPAMQYDDTALFHADHSNLGTTALSSSGLKEGIAAIGNQTRTDREGKAIHSNSSGRVLVVPPDLVWDARELARAGALGDGDDVEVLQESRLGTAGVVDPSRKTVQTGTGTNWLLAAGQAVMPAVAVLGLNAGGQPRLRQYPLEKGKWGLGWDISLDLAAVAIDHRAAFWSTGAA